MYKKKNVAHGGNARQSLMDALVDIASFNKKNSKYMHIKSISELTSALIIYNFQRFCSEVSTQLG